MMRIVNLLNQNQGFVMAILTVVYVVTTIIIAWLTLNAPGEEVTDVIDSSPAFHQSYPEPVFEGVVEYEDSNGSKFKEPFRIDLTFLKKRIYVREASVTDELKQVNETLAVIAKHLEQKESATDVEPQEEI